MRDQIAMRVGQYYLLENGTPCRCVQHWQGSYILHSQWGPQSFVVGAEGHAHHPGTGIAREIGKPPEDAGERTLMDCIGQAVIEGRKAYDAIISFVRANQGLTDS